jgi:hypothetical protein
MKTSYKMKGNIDFIIYLIKLRKKDFVFFLLDLAIFSIAIYEVILNQFSSLISAILIFVFIKVIYNLIKLSIKLKNFFGDPDFKFQTSSNFYVPDFGMIKIDEIDCSSEEAKYKFEKLKIRTKDIDNYILFSHLFNSELIKKESNIIFSRAKRRNIRKFIIQNREILINLLKAKYYESRLKKVFTNDKKLCLSTDIDLTTRTVTCHKAGYFDSFLTNEISTMRLVKYGSEEIVTDGSTYFPLTIRDKKNVCIKNISDSNMNNHIGISTIAFTSDNYFQFWRQSNYSQIGSGLLTATGSGSCNFEDIQGDSFLKTIKFSMERELIEESNQKKKSNFDKSHIQGTKILGYFRWLNRGGKPEFVGVTKLTISHNLLFPDLMETYQPTALENNGLYLVNDFEELKIFFEKIKVNEKLSVPLSVILRFLNELFEKNPTELRTFLFNKS